MQGSHGSAWARRAAVVFVVVVIAGTLAIAIANASAPPPTAGGLAVFVGYAEDKEFITPDPAAFPVPWAGAPNTIFLGGPVPGGTAACGAVAVCFDAGAIRLDNPTSNPITVNSVSVDDHSSVPGGKVIANLWGSFTVPPRQSAILTENPPNKPATFNNFDTSTYPSTCTPVPGAPTVTITVNGVPTTLADSAHVLDTGGIDVGTCPGKHNESAAWRPIGAPGTTTASITLEPATRTAFAGSATTETATVLDGAGGGLPNAAVDFVVTSGPDAGVHGTSITDAAGHASFTFTGPNEGEDVVGASVTTVGTFSSNTVRVMWVDDSASGWTSTDIGGTTPSGSTDFAASTGTFTVQGGGSGIGAASDALRYVYKPVAGSGGVAAHVAPPTNTSAQAVAGVMIRAATTANSTAYAALAGPDGSITVEERPTSGANPTTVATIATNGAAYLWIDDRAGALTTYTSSDGYAWGAVAGSRVALDLGANPVAGLAVSSGNATTLASASFDAVLVPNGSPAPLPTVACPAPWTCSDIGNPTPAGSQLYDPNTATWTLGAGGADIAGTSDQFHFAAQTISGDGTVIARVVSQPNTSASAKAGVMLRAGTDPAAPNYAVVVSPGSGIKVQVRSAQGGPTTKLVNPTGTAPVWLSVKRASNTFTAYTSTNGTTWNLIAGSSFTMPMPNDLLTGLAATSHNTGALASVVFDNVSLPVDASTPTTTTTSTSTSTSTSTTSTSTTSATTVPGPTSTTTLPTNPCPAGWTGADIGSPALAGSDACDPGTGMRTLVAGGVDITGASDQFHYVWQPVTGDAMITAHVASQTNTSSNAKAGVMFRASTDAGAPNYAVLVEPGAGIKVQLRTTQGGTTTKLANPTGTTPAWLRIVRSANTFASYTSPDGATWTLIPGSNVSTGGLPGTVLEGLAETSHNANALCTVVYDVISTAAA